ncbi:DHH family phosphoesterase [Rubellimicrobium aerolatum]|uniref:DHH family phosphoesterase n=1 Tax=Rubellimicrobium aerolatum TaxID=490979 RepID=A0ABW0SFR7_9RHOB|nr:DHH family phosphoesterase [Rubellimicrobium aerolatum]MBP1807257.1 single-stranded-DNA-specific exonuclease [Rubellimicrobium aerolatum]
MSETQVHRSSEVAQAFRAALGRMEPGGSEGPLLVLGHFDADGLSAAAILGRGLERGGRRVALRIVGKGENPWSPDLGAELAGHNPAGLLVTDLGIREGDILPGVPTVLIDHHVPTGTPGEAVVISGNGWEPEPTSALLAYWCAQAIGPAEDLLWLAALGLIGDMSGEAGFAELAEAQARYGKTALRDAVSLVNAPRRTVAADPSPALALLLRCDSPKELLRGGHPETERLHAAKAEVAAALDAAKRVAPKVRGDVALIRFASGCQIHPLIAQQWRGRLRDKIVLAANTGYREGWVHFAARTATGTDLIRFLAAHRPPGADEGYGSGHAQATGGALRPADWNAFIAGLGFPDEQVPA